MPFLRNSPIVGYESLTLSVRRLRRARPVSVQAASQVSVLLVAAMGCYTFLFEPERPHLSYHLVVTQGPLPVDRGRRHTGH